MFENALFWLSLSSALLSFVLGVRFWLTMRDVGTTAPTTSSSVREPIVKGGLPRVSVVMPARNEARDIEQAIRSILAQEGVHVELIVVNDHSTDGTGDIANRLALEDARVRVIHNPPLLPGWFGKANAMQSAWPKTVADWIVFTDADVDHSASCFSTALESLHRQDLDFLSFLPEFQCVSFWENALLPHSFIAGCIHFLPHGINRPGSPYAAAAGAFMLTKRRLLKQIDGLTPVRQEMLDDISLARVVKRNGFKTQIRFAPQLLTVRLFKGNRDAFWGATKNILSAVDQLWLAIPLMFLPMIVYWVPLLSIGLGLWESRWDLLTVGAVTYLVQLTLLLVVRSMCQLKWYMASCFPVSAIPVFCCFLVALYHRVFANSVAWRGRVLPRSDAS